MKEVDIWNIVGFGTEACGKELEITEATKRGVQYKADTKRKRKRYLCVVYRAKAKGNIT